MELEKIFSTIEYLITHGEYEDLQEIVDHGTQEQKQVLFILLLKYAITKDYNK